MRKILNIETNFCTKSSWLFWYTGGSIFACIITSIRTQVNVPQGCWATLHTPPPTLTITNPLPHLTFLQNNFLMYELHLCFSFHLFPTFLPCFMLIIAFIFLRCLDNFIFSISFSFFLSVLSVRISFCFSYHYWPLLLYSHTVLYCTNYFFYPTFLPYILC